MIDFETLRARFKTAATRVSAMPSGSMPSMPPPSFGGGFGTGQIVGFTGGGGRLGRKLVGSNAGAAMVARHQGHMAAQQMMHQNEFNKAYANALMRMSKTSSELGDLDPMYARI